MVCGYLLCVWPWAWPVVDKPEVPVLRQSHGEAWYSARKSTTGTDSKCEPFCGGQAWSAEHKACAGLGCESGEYSESGHKEGLSGSGPFN